MKTIRIVGELHSVFEKYVVTAPGVSLVLGLWVINSYLWQRFEFCPYLFITSPVKRCGKTTLLTLLNHLCNRPLFASSITSAALARSIGQQKPTLLLDEAENLTNEVRTVLNAGFKKGGTILRCAGSNVEEVDVYGPKAIAAIERIPETVYDRSIVVTMRRKQPTQDVEPLRTRAIKKETDRLRRRIQEWVETHRKEVLREYKHIELDSLTDREVDIWQPLFAIASVAAPSRLAELRRVAVQLSSEKAKGDLDDSHSLQLLEHLRQVFCRRFQKDKAAKLSTDDLLAELARTDNRRWGNFDAVELAKRLRPFGVEPKQLWVAGDNVRGYRLKDFSEAFDYLQVEAVPIRTRRRT